MSEASEVARAMLGRYLSWLEYTDTPQDMRSARDYVRMMLPDESTVMQDNTAESLIQQAKENHGN